MDIRLRAWGSRNLPRASKRIIWQSCWFHCRCRMHWSYARFEPSSLTPARGMPGSAAVCRWTPARCTATRCRYGRAPAAACCRGWSTAESSRDAWKTSLMTCPWCSRGWSRPAPLANLCATFPTSISPDPRSRSVRLERKK